MQIKIRLLGFLREHLPAQNAGYDDATLELPADATIDTLAAQVGLGREFEYFVMRNGEHVADTAHATTRLAEGDNVVFCPPLKGG